MADSRKRTRPSGSPVAKPFIKSEPNLDNSTEEDNGSTPLPKCMIHLHELCTFWCKECTLAICMTCVKNKHRDHNLVFLESVISEKVQESILRLDYIRDRLSIVESNVDFCKSEINYHDTQVKLLKRNLISCETIRDYPKVFDPHMQALLDLASGVKGVKLDPKILGNFLQLLRKTDNDIFCISKPSKAMCKVRSEAIFKSSPVQLCSLSGFDFDLKVDFQNSSLALLCSPQDNSMHVWSIKVDFKLSIPNEEQQLYSVDKTVVNQIFSHKETVYEFDFETYKPWMDNEDSQGYVPFVFEIFVHE